MTASFFVLLICWPIHLRPGGDFEPSRCRILGGTSLSHRLYPVGHATCHLLPCLRLIFLRRGCACYCSASGYRSWDCFHHDQYAPWI